jgi:tetratricopeptide (TPR) repeat protein
MLRIVRVNITTMADMTTAHTGKKRVLVIVGVVAILALAGGAGAFVRSLQTKDNKQAANDPRTTTKSGISHEVDELQNLRASGDAEAAAQKIDEGLNKPSSSDKERYYLYIQQGNILADKQDYPGAIASYEKAEAITMTYEIESLLGDTYKSAGNKAKAIEYYKKAIPLVPPTPIQDDERDSLEKMIKLLESQP